MLFRLIGLGISFIFGSGGDSVSGGVAAHYLPLISLGRQETPTSVDIRHLSTSLVIEAQVRRTLDITSIGIFWYVHVRVSGIGCWHLRVRWQAGVIGSSGGLVELRERLRQQKIISTVFGFEQDIFGSR